MYILEQAKLNFREGVKNVRKIIAIVGYEKYKTTLKQALKYDEAKAALMAVTKDADKIINIIECESNEYERRLAFIETTYREILSGADYSKCETMEDLSKVYASSLINRLMN